jgi:serine/threonine-protein kinase RsbW
MSQQTFRLNLKSTHEESERVPDFVAGIQGETDLSDDETSGLMLLVSEAVTNAIEHGNKLTASKNVEVELIISAAKITVTVTDEGEGFDPSQAKDPLKKENLLDDSGRGIFLMKQFSDEMEYLNEGRTVRFIIYR